MLWIIIDKGFLFQLRVDEDLLAFIFIFLIDGLGWFSKEYAQHMLSRNAYR